MPVADLSICCTRTFASRVLGSACDMRMIRKANAFVRARNSLCLSVLIVRFSVFIGLKQSASDRSRCTSSVFSEDLCCPPRKDGIGAELPITAITCDYARLLRRLLHRPCHKPRHILLQLSQRLVPDVHHVAGAVVAERNALVFGCVQVHVVDGVLRAEIGSGQVVKA